MTDDFKTQLSSALNLAASGLRDDAISRLEKLGITYPRHAQLWNELGVLYYQEKSKEKAANCFRRAIDCDGNFARAHSNLGACQNDFGDNATAIMCYERALEINPKLADAWGNLGKLWNDQREYEFAAYCYQRALDIERKPAHLRGLGSAYRLSGRYSRAMALFQEAVAKQPDDAFSHTALAALYFYHENYPVALREYEWRWQLPDMAQHQRNYPQLFAKPAYQGESLREKTVLVHTEQGYGDNLLFCRYINSLKDQAKQVVMWCWPGLVDLFADNFAPDFITGDATNLPDFDVHIPLLSLPLHFDQQLQHMNGDSPYLRATPNAATVIPTSSDKLNVGIVWGCDHNGFDYAHKKIPLNTLGPLFSMPGVRFYSLQLNPDRQELVGSEYSPLILDLAPQLKNFKDTAEIISQLDLVISVDTAVAHLSAAMGKPTWVLLKKNPDWRWHGYDGHALWYPNARLFCQHPLDGWDSVVNRVRNALARAVEEKATNQWT